MASAELTKAEDSETKGNELQSSEVTGSEDSSGTGSDGDDTIRVEDLPSYKESFGDSKPDAAPQKAELPGESIEDFEAKAKQARAYSYQTTLQTRGQAIVEKLQSELGISQEEAVKAWGLMSPVVNILHGNNEEWSAAIWNRAVELGVPEPAAKKYNSHIYRNRAEAVNSLYTIGKEESDAAWEEKVKNDYIPRSKLQKFIDDGNNAYRKKLEDAGLINGATSGPGDGVRSLGGRSGSFRSETDLNRAYNTPGNPMYDNHSAYKAEYKRITGKDP